MTTATTLEGKVVVVLDPNKVHTLLTGESGPVVRDLLKRGERVKIRARSYAPRVTGNLADHIVKRLVHLNGGPAVIVGPQGVSYAKWVHEGTQPHVIYARRAPRLVFFWPKVGRVVAFPKVNHPGTKPNRFLLRALRAAA